VIAIDASVWVSILVPQDAHHQVSRGWLEGWQTGGHRIVAPNLLAAEASGAVARRTGQAQRGRQVLADLLTDPLVELVPLDDELGLEAARLAADLGLRGADAVYVAVARRRGVPLLTWDREQLARATRVVAAQEPVVP
jgi:predicted nucleic acid-binding protein